LAAPRWMKFLNEQLGKLAKLSFRRPWLFLSLALVLSILGGFAAYRLSLSANLVELLPPSFQSVQDLKQLEKEFGGMGWVVVLGEGATSDKLIQFSEDLVPLLEKLPDVSFVDHQRPARFFSEHALYYLQKEDLTEILRRLESHKREKVKKENPFLIEIDETEKAEPSDISDIEPALDFSDIFEKYKNLGVERFAKQLNTAQGLDDYYLDKEAKKIAVLVKPKGFSANLGFAKHILEEVEKTVNTLDLSQYGADFRVTYTGSHKKKIDQQDQIARDIGLTSGIAAVILLLYLVYYFRSLWAVAIVFAPLGIGLVFIYGLVGLTYGQVNLLTGFLGAILGGLGIEHGIHLLTRFFSFNNQGGNWEDSIFETFCHTGGSALIAAFVAALTFLSLGFSEFRAFHEFGVIAAFGMLLLVISYLVFLPAFLSILKKLGWKGPRLKHEKQVENSTREARFRWLEISSPYWSVFFILLCVGSLFFLKDLSFDYDFSSLEDQNLPSFVLDKEVNKIIGYSQTPVVVLTNSSEDEQAVVRTLKERKEAKGADSGIDFVGAISELLPEEQAEKYAILQKMVDFFENVEVSTPLPFEQKQLHAKPFTLEELPNSIRQQFSGKTGGTHVLIYQSISFSDGKGIQNFSKEVRGLELPSGEHISAAGEPLILGDILDMVSKEGPFVLLGAILAVTLAMWLSLGGLKESLLCLIPSLASVFCLIAFMSVFGIKFNYLNILVLPTIIGCTVDAGVHFVSRLNEPGEKFSTAYFETGKAIFGGLMTSIVGFVALMLAKHPGLNSLGMLSILGLFINLIIVLLIFPAFLLLAPRFKPRGKST